MALLFCVVDIFEWDSGRSDEGAKTMFVYVGIIF